MQQYPGNRAPRPVRVQRIQSTLPGTTSSIAPTLVPTQNNMLPLPSKKRPEHVRRAVLKLLGLGVVLEGLYLALYPLLASAITKNAAARQAMLGIFPWLPHLYWTSWLPFLTRALVHIPALDPSKSGNANLFALLLACAFVPVLLAARVGNRITRERLSATQRHTIFLTMLILTSIFGLTYLCAPGMMSQDMFLYGLKGRMIVVYHVNPYLVTQAAFPRDILYTALLQGVRDAVVYGPVWFDLSILVALPAGASVANIMIGFRLLGLIAHLLNTILIWAILAKLKPEARIYGTLLYAWNPLVLLMSVAEMHQTVVVVLFVLLAVFLLQRNSLMFSWIFLLLATLINFWCLLVLPLFFRLLGKEARAMRRGEGLLWWLGLICVSALVMVLAYTP
jgi:hypothetical protein